MTQPSTNLADISPIKAFNDNYIWAMHNQESALVVDPGDAKPVISFLTKHNLNLDTILITHHHYDHTGGVLDLLAAFPNAQVYGPNNPDIKGITHTLVENDSFSVAALNVTFSVLETPGHTLDHIVFVTDDLVFCGDTLFSAGCGRMFEGTADVFYTSLQKLAALPPSTKVYCTHEYTQANIKFALHVDKQNKDLIKYADWVKQQRQQDAITLPSTIEKESAINPFLRCHSPNIIQSLKIEQAPTHDSGIQVFASLRKLKDNF